MKSRKASMNVKRKVHNEYVLPVMVYGSKTWALKKAHMELLSVAQRKMERICSDSPYATTNVIPGYDIRQVLMISYTLSRREYMDGRDTLHDSKTTDGHKE